MRRETRPIADRIMEAVEFDTVAGCWLWSRRLGQNGYGSLWDGREQRAHRASYAAFVGPIPEGLLVCHKCDVRACVNPAHLYLGTHKDNMADQIARNRTQDQRGGKNPNAKVSEAVAAAIVREFDPGRGPRSRGGPNNYRALADRYGVGLYVVRNIANGASWKHLPRDR